MMFVQASLLSSKSLKVADPAIEKAAELSGIADYKLATYPKKVDFVTSIISNAKPERYISSKLENTFGDFYNGFMMLENLDKADRLQARIPFEMSIN